MSRTAVILARLVPLTVLPSGVWRTLLGLGFGMGFSPAALQAGDIPGWGSAWAFFLTVLTEALALLTIGLVRPWGEVVPAWVPWLGGRRIPPVAVVVPATAGGLLLIVIWTFAVGRLFVTPVEEFTGGTGWWVLLVSCYLPALLWGPLLLSVTYLYYRANT
ncbi:hypothetical protein AB0C12_34090 [Actinoplanes sp. NPDC048967]|uniref:hypothetical protein n=1 Tax=Actinoplanes sp. NPDC048967 TaxID=3155269 RepID=UPI0033DE115E